MSVEWVCMHVCVYEVWVWIVCVRVSVRACVFVCTCVCASSNLSMQPRQPDIGASLRVCVLSVSMGVCAWVYVCVYKILLWFVYGLINDEHSKLNSLPFLITNLKKNEY